MYALRRSRCWTGQSPLESPSSRRARLIQGRLVTLANARCSARLHHRETTRLRIARLARLAPRGSTAPSRTRKRSTRCRDSWNRWPSDPRGRGWLGRPDDGL